MSFGSDFTDNPAGPGEGDGEAIATFLLGIPDGGAITSVTPNIIYNRQIYAVYALDDFKVSPRLTLNLGLRYELFTTIKEANNNSATFDFNSQSLIVPSGQNAQLTPTLATELPILRNGSRGLISPDTNNFAPRIGLCLSIVRQARPPQRLWHLLWRPGKRPILQSKPRFQSSVLVFGGVHSSL